MDKIYNLPLFYKIDTVIEGILIKKLEEKKIKRIIFLSDEIVYKLYGEKYLNILMKKFEVENLNIDLNSISYSMKLAEKVIENEIEIIIGIGGGKVLDTCKYISFITKIPFISLPTTIANDGIASPIAVLKDKENFTRSLGAKVPAGILIDLSIVKNTPIRFLKAGIGDILSNYTALFDWELSGEEVNDFAYLISKTAFNSIFYFEDKNLNNDSFIKKVIEAIILSGISMEIAGTSRPCSGAEHLFSHYIDKYYNKNNLHGFQVALGSIVTCYLQNRNYVELIEFLKELDINISPSNLNISLTEFIVAWKNCRIMRKGKITILDFIKINEQKLEEIYYILEEEFKNESSNFSSGNRKQIKTTNK